MGGGGVEGLDYDPMRMLSSGLGLRILIDWIFSDFSRGCVRADGSFIDESAGRSESGKLKKSQNNNGEKYTDTCQMLAFQQNKKQKFWIDLSDRCICWRREEHMPLQGHQVQVYFYKPSLLGSRWSKSLEIFFHCSKLAAILSILVLVIMLSLF